MIKNQLVVWKSSEKHPLFDNGDVLTVQEVDADGRPVSVTRYHGSVVHDVRSVQQHLVPYAWLTGHVYALSVTTPDIMYIKALVVNVTSDYIRAVVVTRSERRQGQVGVWDTLDREPLDFHPATGTLLGNHPLSDFICIRPGSIEVADKRFKSHNVTENGFNVIDTLKNRVSLRIYDSNSADLVDKLNKFELSVNDIAWLG